MGLQRVAAGDYRLHGDLSFATVPELYRAASSQWAQQMPAVVDLAGVGRSDSAGLALLVEWLRQAQSGQTMLCFSHIPDQLAKLIRISGLSQAFALPSQSSSR
ncbi:MAG: STAS domain-containing protein [Gammaproteobacteria bacterium]|nr:STAS domain-containing protein [Gammaproteobacteria bacterium]